MTASGYSTKVVDTKSAPITPEGVPLARQDERRKWHNWREQLAWSAVPNPIPQGCLGQLWENRPTGQPSCLVRRKQHASRVVRPLTR
jgi:hypothetical protein